MSILADLGVLDQPDCFPAATDSSEPKSELPCGIANFLGLQQKLWVARKARSAEKCGTAQRKDKNDEPEAALPLAKTQNIVGALATASRDLAMGRNLTASQLESLSQILPDGPKKEEVLQRAEGESKKAFRNRIKDREKLLRSITDPKNAKTVDRCFCLPSDLRKRALLELRILELNTFQRRLRKKVLSADARLVPLTRPGGLAPPPPPSGRKRSAPGALQPDAPIAPVPPPPKRFRASKISWPWLSAAQKEDAVASAIEKMSDSMVAPEQAATSEDRGPLVAGPDQAAASAAFAGLIGDFQTATCTSRRAVKDVLESLSLNVRRAAHEADGMKLARKAATDAADKERGAVGPGGMESLANELLKIKLEKVCKFVAGRRREMVVQRNKKRTEMRTAAHEARMFFDSVEARLKTVREREQKERMRLLKDNDIDSYRNLLRKTKNTRLTELLDQTDTFLAALGDRVDRQKRMNNNIRARQKKEKSSKDQKQKATAATEGSEGGEAPAAVDAPAEEAEAKITEISDEPTTANGADHESANKAVDDVPGSSESKVAEREAAVASEASAREQTEGSGDVQMSNATDATAASAPPKERAGTQSGTKKLAEAAESGEGPQPGDAAYYSMAHDINENIIEQPSILEGGKLMPYQLLGLQFLVSLYNNKLSGILADEMGLGKTVQTIALLAYLKEFKKNNGPHLVIVPLSTMPNWISEFGKWCPSINLVVYQGSKLERRPVWDAIRRRDFEVCVTTYDFIIRDRHVLASVDWAHIIVDEGHRMKNAKSKFHVTLHGFYSTHRLLLTGTPLQNNMSELWALLNFILPDIFSSMDDFERWFEQPFRDMAIPSAETSLELTAEEQLLVINRLHAVLRPFLLRRVKAEVIEDLPDKREFVVRIHLSKWQSLMYDQLSKKAMRTMDAQGKVLQKSVNNVVMQLRKIANHPYLFRNEYHLNEDLYRVSGKFEVLDRILTKLIHFGHKVLIFCQMTQLMDILGDYLDWKGVKYHRLDGSSGLDDRRTRMSEFNDPACDVHVFMLSTRAGGLGLNLQAADTVVLFDSDWNPHQDLQAQARAHRIGQKREVRVFRLVTISGIEEAILQKAKHKLGIDEKVIQAGMFNSSASDEQRDQRLRQILATSEDLNAEIRVTTPYELNRYLARSEEEENWFNHFDRKELNVHPTHDLTKWMHRLADDKSDRRSDATAEMDALLVGTTSGSAATSEQGGLAGDGESSASRETTKQSEDSGVPSPMANAAAPTRGRKKRGAIVAAAFGSAKRTRTSLAAAVASNDDKDAQQPRRGRSRGLVADHGGAAANETATADENGGEGSSTAGESSKTGEVGNGSKGVHSELTVQLETLLIDSGRLMSAEEIPEELLAEPEPAEEEVELAEGERRVRKVRQPTGPAGENVSDAGFMRALQRYENGLEETFEEALRKERESSGLRNKRRSQRGGEEGASKDDTSNKNGDDEDDEDDEEEEEEVDEEEVPESDEAEEDDNEIDEDEDGSDDEDGDEGGANGRKKSRQSTQKKGSKKKSGQKTATAKEQPGTRRSRKSAPPAVSEDGGEEKMEERNVPDEENKKGGSFEAAEIGPAPSVEEPQGGAGGRATRKRASTAVGARKSETSSTTNSAAAASEKRNSADKKVTQKPADKSAEKTAGDTAAGKTKDAAPQKVGAAHQQPESEGRPEEEAAVKAQTPRSRRKTLHDFFVKTNTPTAGGDAESPKDGEVAADEGKPGVTAVKQDRKGAVAKRKSAPGGEKLNREKVAAEDSTAVEDSAAASRGGAKRKARGANARQGGKTGEGGSGGNEEVVESEVTEKLAGESEGSSARRPDAKEGVERKGGRRLRTTSAAL